MQKVAIQYHKTLDELPRTKFIDCDVDGNLASLIIGPVPAPEELTEVWPSLQKAWMHILSQYGDRIGTAEYKMYINLYKEINTLTITINQVNFIAGRGNKAQGIAPGVLRMYYVEELARELNDILKTSCRFNFNDPKSYHAELDKCLNRSKAFNIQKSLKLLAYEAIEKKNQSSSGVKPDRAYYDAILVTLSDHVKYHLPEDIKMGQYCERITRFIKASETKKQ